MVRKIRAILSLLIGLLLCLSLVAAEVYDDFSGSALDATKWAESTKYDFFSDEHFVDTTRGVYHVAQKTFASSGAGTELTPTRVFQVGETLEFDIFYNSASGNNIVGFESLMIDGTARSTQTFLVGSCSTPMPGCARIGQWNGITDVGNQYGMYHLKMEFLEEGITLTTTRPDNSEIIHNFAGISAPYKPLFMAMSGHNGLFNIDYDNFEVNSESEEPPVEDPTCDELDIRLEALESAVSNLQTENTELKDNLDSLAPTVDDLQTQLDAHINDTTMEERVSGLSDRVEALEVAIDHQWDKMKVALDTAVANLQAQLDDHEERISKLEKLHPRIWKDNFPWFKR